MTPHDDADDLAWQAFAYASDALDAGASLAFEQRLDDDQAAREALAEAVLLAGVVKSAAAATRGRNRRAVAFAAAGFLSAAALAFVSAPRLFAPTPADSGSAVALAWSGLREVGESSPGRDNLDAWLTEPNPEPTSAAGPESEAGESADSPPHWLLEAAALPAPEEGQGS